MRLLVQLALASHRIKAFGGECAARAALLFFLRASIRQAKGLVVAWQQFKPCELARSESNGNHVQSIILNLSAPQGLPMSLPVDAFMSYLGQLVVYGGGAVAIAYALFKTLGEKWLDARFATRLQEIKVAQDEQLRYVQSFIDREIHRARKLYDREFDTLSEAWRLFCVSFGNGIQVGVDQYPPYLERYTKEELSNVLSTTDMRDFEKADMLAMDSSRWTEHFRRWSNYKRYNGYFDDRWAFKNYLQANAIFFSAGIKERFEVLDSLIGIAISEMHMRLQNPSFNSFDAAVKLAQEGPKLKDELEAIIAERLWSSDAAKSKTDKVTA